MKSRINDVDEVLQRDFEIVSAEDAKAAGVRVWHRLQPDGTSELETRLDKAQPAASVNWRYVGAAAAAVVVLAASIGTAILWPRGDTALYRVVDGTVQTGDTIQTNGGAQLALADESRVEMRSQSELSLERADDGLRIRLSKGGIIVNAATQRTGHLYVQTKDVTVSVVGTVFLVNADEAGSRVAVIEGEVQVQQGDTKKKLLPGEQVSTSLTPDSPPVNEAIGWSRNAEALITLLQQSAVAPPAVSPQNSTEPREAFDVASIRASGPPTGSGGRGGGGEPCAGGSARIDPRRFVVTKATLNNLITLAYGLGGAAGGNAAKCANAIGQSILSGGPEWASDQFDVQAVIPEGAADHTSTTIGGVSVQEPGPRLRRMLQALLADRFKLVLRRDTKELPGYVLVVAKGGPKLTAWQDGNPVSLGGYSYAAPTRDRAQLASSITGRKATVAQLAGRIETVTLRPVIDRTGITGDFNFHIEFAPPPDFTGFPTLFPGIPAMTSPSLSTALEEQLGLRLEATRVPVEVLVIERAERPSEN
jgi:uncharacterized protein (TIGR03435 family)